RVRSQPRPSAQRRRAAVGLVLHVHRDSGDDRSAARRSRASRLLERPAGAGECVAEGAPSREPVGASMEAWIVVAVLAAVATYCWNRWRRLARAEFIRHYTFPHGLFDKVHTKRPELEKKDLQLVAHALRQFFLAYLNGGRRYVSMPSQVVDDLW